MCISCKYNPKKSTTYSIVSSSWSKTLFLWPVIWSSPQVATFVFLLLSRWRVNLGELSRDAGSDRQGQRSKCVWRWLEGKRETPPPIRAASPFIEVYFTTLFSWTSPAAVSLSGVVFLFPSAGFPFLSLLLLRLHLSPVVWHFSALHSSCVCVCVCLYQKGVAGTSFSSRVCERDFEFFIRNLLKLCASRVYLNVHVHFWHCSGWWMCLYVFSLCCCHVMMVSVVDDLLFKIYKSAKFCFWMLMQITDVAFIQTATAIRVMILLIKSSRIIISRTWEKLLFMLKDISEN